jgi:hypothetical protein
VEVHALDVVERPHVVVLEVRLGDQRLPVGAHEPDVAHDLGQLPPVVAVEEVAVADVAARVGLVEPHALLGAVEPRAAVDLAVARVVREHAPHQADPARGRGLLERHVQEVLELLGVVARLAKRLPRRAVLGVPARVLRLHPLEVALVQRLGPPEVEHPERRGAEHVLVHHAALQALLRAIEHLGREIEAELPELQDV